MRSSVVFCKSWLVILFVLSGFSIAYSKSLTKTKVKSEVVAGQPHFEKKTIRIGGKRVTVEIAETDLQRTHGLMHRESMPEDQGMLFIFENERPLGFWMMNTLIPLSIGYFDAQKVLVDVQEMVPATIGDMQPPVYKSSKPARYALEMNKGWFTRNKIKPGATFEFAQDLRRSTDKTSR